MSVQFRDGRRRSVRRMPDPTSRTRLLVWGLVLVAALVVGLALAVGYGGAT